MREEEKEEDRAEDVNVILTPIHDVIYKSKNINNRNL
jgi:hypothetical protein